jgi:cell wall-associated NlpC family hydrolase
MSLPSPEPFGIDTDLSGVGGNPILASPDVDDQLALPSFDDFRAATSNSGFSSFRAVMNGLDGKTDTISSTGSGGDTATGTRAEVVQYAKKFLGMNYAWGGSNPNTSFDCSGFTQYVLGHFGVHLPRISYQQANYGKRTALNKLQAGDLVAWDNSSRNQGADHIALYIGGGQIMEFSRPGRPSRIRKLGSNEGAWGVAINYK